MAALSWDEIVEIGKQHNKTVICEVERLYTNRCFKLRCNICGYEKTDTMRGFSRCKVCGVNKTKSNNDEFLIKAEKIYGNKFSYFLNDYVNSKSKITIKCNDCENIFTRRINDHLLGRECSFCLKIFKRSNTEDFIHKANIVHPEKYDYSLVEYVNCNKKVKIICKKCNFKFLQNPSNHLSGQGCPKCNESKGENKISYYLYKNNIQFIPYKGFESLRDIRSLKFDFYLEDLNLLVEYDGMGHYLACFGFTLEQKQKNLEGCQRRDKIKDEWAKANNIPLLRIPYWDYDRIEELIDAFILQHTRKKEVKQLVLEI